MSLDFRDADGGFWRGEFGDILEKKLLNAEGAEKCRRGRGERL
jgi:hypothetical protein